MEDNTININGTEYSIDDLSPEAQHGCALFVEVQEKRAEALRNVDIYTAALQSLDAKIVELVEGSEPVPVE